MMGIFSKRVNSAGAVAGMLVGVVSTAVYIFLYRAGSSSGTNSLANTPDQWWMGISPQAFGAVGAILNFIVAYAVSWRLRLRRRKSGIWSRACVPRGAGAALDH